MVQKRLSSYQFIVWAGEVVALTNQLVLILVATKRLQVADEKAKQEYLLQEARKKYGLPDVQQAPQQTPDTTRPRTKLRKNR